MSFFTLKTLKLQENLLKIYKNPNFVNSNYSSGTRIYLIGRLHYQGGQVMADGTRTPRMTSIQAENIYPLAKASSFQAQQGRDFGYGRQQQYQPRRDQMEEEEED